MAEAKGDWLLALAYIKLMSLPVAIGLNLMWKVVTYWLAKLLDPQHNVVLSDEHQDFKVSPHMISNLGSNLDE